MKNCLDTGPWVKFPQNFFNDDVFFFLFEKDKSLALAYARFYHMMLCEITRGNRYQSSDGLEFKVLSLMKDLGLRTAGIVNLFDILLKKFAPGSIKLFFFRNEQLEIFSDDLSDIYELIVTSKPLSNHYLFYKVLISQDFFLLRIKNGKHEISQWANKKKENKNKEVINNQNHFFLSSQQGVNGSDGVAAETTNLMRQRGAPNMGRAHKLKTFIDQMHEVLQSRIVTTTHELEEMFDVVSRSVGEFDAFNDKLNQVIGDLDEESRVVPHRRGNFIMTCLRRHYFGK